MKKDIFTHSVIAAIMGVLTACQTPELPQTYEQFLDENREKYPVCMDVYLNRDLVAKATPESPIHICLDQQRGRLYADGQVAADWPVTTGMEGRETPTGSFSVLEKKKLYFSTTWGTIVDENDICVVESADSRVDKVPPGGEFLGAKMENWQRLTHNGVGIHTGPVRMNKKLSKGCVRTPGFVADMLFDLTKVGTKVHISQAPEEIWPGLPAEE